MHVCAFIKLSNTTSFRAIAPVKLNIRVPRNMAAPSMADVALSNAQGSGDGNLSSISPEDMLWVEAYALEKNATSSTSSAAQLQRFNEVFRRATAMAATGKGIQLVDKLCGIVPGVLRRATDDDIAAGALSQETSRTYEYMLTMLCSPKELTLSSVALLLRPLCQLNTGSNTSLELTPSIELYISNISFSKDRFSSMCSDLLQYLTHRIPEMASTPVSSQRYTECSVKNQAFSDVVNGIHTIACWGLSYYGSSPELGVVRDSVGRLQETVWEQLIDVKHHWVAMVSIEAAIKATIAPTAKASNEPLPTLKWLEEKRILWRLLRALYRMNTVPQASVLLSQDLDFFIMKLFKICSSWN